MSDQLFGKSESPEPAKDTGIIETTDSIQMNVPVEAPAEAAEPATTEWMVDDNTKGEGDRPEWLKDKYKSVYDQAKAYPDLEKVKPLQNAPESYDLSFLPEDNALDMESDAMKQWIEIKKEQKASDAQVQKELTFMNQYFADANAKTAQDVGKEVDKFGGKEAYEQKREAFENTVCNLLSKEDAAKLFENVKSFDAYDSFNKLISHFQESPVAAIEAIKPVDKSHLSMTLTEYMNYNVVNHADKLKNDEAFQDQYYKNCKEIEANSSGKFGVR